MSALLPVALQLGGRRLRVGTGQGRAGRCEWGRGKQLTVDINISLGKLLTLAQIETDETRAGLFEERSVCSWMMTELFYDIASQSLGFTLPQHLLSSAVSH